MSHPLKAEINPFVASGVGWCSVCMLLVAEGLLPSVPGKHSLLEEFFYCKFYYYFYLSVQPIFLSSKNFHHGPHLLTGSLQMKVACLPQRLDASLSCLSSFSLCPAFFSFLPVSFPFLLNETSGEGV